MQTAITNNVMISVETAYQNNSHPNYKDEHMFAYRITIQNQSEYTIKLLRRHWFICDAVKGTSEVEGEGVVGQQPTLEPGETHQYVSGCAIISNIGKMQGTYLMERAIDGELFKVNIPEFILVAPFFNN